ncbi:hypothetical protein ACFOEW_17010 [Alteromonas oceani]|uniref:Uncharacterized protein n=1 Tax=Alteromonas oceani TaxID=2071609 RepID=A0ABV7K257_9ALTE|nr:hypothetical protein [Alteromonas oceani]
MKTYDITPNDWLKGGLVTLLLFVIFQLGALVGQTSARLYAEHEAVDKIKARISLDLQFLDVGNQTLRTPPNQDTLKAYLNRINTILSEQQTGVWLVSLQSVTANAAGQPENARLTQLVLENSEQTVNVQLATKPLYRYLSFSPLALLAALLVSPAFVKVRTSQRRAVKAAVLAQPVPIVKITPKLTVNLNEKTLGNGVNDVTVQLQNKPLCFYTALLHYCIENPNAVLLHHKDIPPELTNLASKVFTRLMELGHTKRKRPDFNANLDKTLSEIRAALDEVFAGFSEEKTRYYPPRAQGEGSRSKQHSYALPVLHASDIDIIGE